MQLARPSGSRAPRCQYLEHGVVKLHVPWAEPHGHSTLMFEAFAVSFIQPARFLVQAMEILKAQRHTIQKIAHRASKRGPLDHVGMDKKSFGNGQDYVSLMSDLNGRPVLDVVLGRDTARALELWSRLPEQQRDRIDAVANNMGPELRAETRQSAYRAGIVNEAFHVGKHLNEAVHNAGKRDTAVCCTKAPAA